MTYVPNGGLNREAEPSIFQMIDMTSERVKCVRDGDGWPGRARVEIFGECPKRKNDLRNLGEDFLRRPPLEKEATYLLFSI